MATYNVYSQVRDVVEVILCPICICLLILVYVNAYYAEFEGCAVVFVVAVCGGVLDRMGNHVEKSATDQNNNTNTKQQT